MIVVNDLRPLCQRTTTAYKVACTCQDGYNATKRVTSPERDAMTFNWEKILESKCALRHHLAGRPIAEKLPMLNALRELPE